MGRTELFQHLVLPAAVVLSYGWAAAMAFRRLGQVLENLA